MIEQIRDWLRYQWFRWENRNDRRPTDVIVRECTARVREILADEPADKLVHTALEMCDVLDEKFSD